MDCPNCGSQIAYDQQFCRNCGEVLKASAQRSRIPRALWGLTLAFAGILIALIGSMLEVRAVLMIGVIMSALVMSSIAAMSLLYQGRKQPSRISEQPASMPKADTTNKLPPISARDHFPSVTEHTTNRLEHPEPQSSRSDA